VVNSEELIGTTEYQSLQTRCRTNRCRYKRVSLYFGLFQIFLFATVVPKYLGMTLTHKNAHIKK
jgi:hypothetical protein